MSILIIFLLLKMNFKNEWILIFFNKMSVFDNMSILVKKIILCFWCGDYISRHECRLIWSLHAQYSRYSTTEQLRSYLLGFFHESHGMWQSGLLDHFRESGLIVMISVWCMEVWALKMADKANTAELIRTTIPIFTRAKYDRSVRKMPTVCDSGRMRLGVSRFTMFRVKHFFYRN